MRLVFDTLEDTRATVTRAGVEYRRGVLAVGVGGGGAEKIARATRAPGLPGIGAPFPGDARAVLEQIEALGVGGAADTLRLVLIYRSPNRDDAKRSAGGIAIVDVEFFVATVSETRNTDADGNAMINTFRGPLWSVSGQAFGVGILAEKVEVDAFRPHWGVRIRHERPALPKALAAAVHNSVNARPWSGYAAGTWLCTGLPADTRSGLATCTFEALYKPEGWRVHHAVTYNGQVPEAAVPGNGIAEFDIYRRVDWQAAGLGVDF